MEYKLPEKGIIQLTPGEEIEAALMRIESSTKRNIATKAARKQENLATLEVFEADQEDARVKRLNYLLEQTESLTEFMNSASKDEKTKENNSNKANVASSSTNQKSVKANEAFQFEDSPDFINGKMRDYQVRGLNWMINLYENGLNGILADEMGLGKTLQTISLLGYMRHHKDISGKHLILAPKSTIDNWINEFKRWCPEIYVVGFFGNKDQRKYIRKIYLKTSFDVVITNYETCLNESSVLKNINWSFIIVDEGHRMKNEKNKFSKYIRTFRSSNRLLLTGTPLQNNMHELWALLNFLLPDIFTSSDDFDNWFDTDKCLTDGNLVQRLHKILAPFLLRRIKSEVELSLLPKLEYKLYCGITKIQRELYIKVLKKEFQIIHPVYGVRVKTEPMQIMMQLRQLVNHPYILPGVEPEPLVTDETLVKCCGKLQMLDKLLVMLKRDGSRVLIFTQFVSMLDILEDYLTLRKYSYCRLDGSSNYEDRKEDINSFNITKSDKFVFIISTRAGGLGINLQTADAVIIYDSDWNPQSDIQAIDRAHRIGQKKQVKVFRLIAEKTIDERIVERAEIKLCLDKKVIQEGRLVANCGLKKNEILNMINYDAEFLVKSTEATVTDEDIDQIIKSSLIKSEELKKRVEANEVNFETIFKFDGELYRKQEEHIVNDKKRRKILRSSSRSKKVPKLEIEN